MRKRSAKTSDSIKERREEVVETMRAPNQTLQARPVHGNQASALPEIIQVIDATAFQRNRWRSMAAVVAGAGPAGRERTRGGWGRARSVSA